MEKFMKITIKILIFFIAIIVLLGISYALYNLFGTKSINLNEITSSEKDEILKVIGLNNINDNLELEKLEIPRTYKDIYYTLYFSINLNNNEDILDNNKIDNLDIEFNIIEENENIIKYRCTISNMGKSVEILEHIIDRYYRL